MNRIIVISLAVVLGPLSCAHNPGSTEATARAGQTSDPERGRYLAENVLGCKGCHTARDYDRYGAPLSGEPFAGACFEKVARFFELPETVCAPNITSDETHGIGAWTDDELLRALREGRGKDGRALFPYMPWPEYRALSDDDARAVVSYLRTVPPVAKDGGRTVLPPELAKEIASLPSPLPGPVPPPADQGAYLAKVAQCSMCHSGEAEDALPFVGGIELTTPHGKERTANLTPHPEGLGRFTEEAFVALFASMRHSAGGPAKEGQVNKLIMPWSDLSGLRERDLRLVYRYLRSIRPGQPTRVVNQQN